jgi:hypothetical protein
MAKLKKDTAKLVLQGISVIGILIGFYLFVDNVYTIFSVQRDNAGVLSSLRLFEVGMLVLAAFLIYSSYLMLRGKSFKVIKSFSVLPAMMSFSLVARFGDLFTNTDIEEKSSTIESIVTLASVLVSAFVFVIIYTISVILLERLKEAAYGPEKISETQNSSDKPKKTIARLILEGISILGILLGIIFLYMAIDMTLPIHRDELNKLYFLFFPLVWGFVLAGFLIYPSYLMLRGRSFGILKTIAALLALTLSSPIIHLYTAFPKTLDSEDRFIKDSVIFASLAVYWLVFAFVYKISIKLLEMLKEVAYGPEKISETQNSTDKQ